MENYWQIWGWYSLAALVFCLVYWRVTRFPNFPWVSISLRALMLTLIFTPWFTCSEPTALTPASPTHACSEYTTLAPALMVATLDVITIGGSAASRALQPLMLSLLFVEILVTLYCLHPRNRKPRKPSRPGVGR